MNIDHAETADIAARRRSGTLVGAAVKRHSMFSRAGINERVFTFAFSNLVYPQIWEDPAVDLQAMQVAPGHRIMTIASGGCNALSYLTANPAEIVAVDLNASHVALNRLKIAAARHLPDYESFYSLLGVAGGRANLELFDRYIADQLDASSRAFWTGRDMFGRRRITYFVNGFHRYGLLGRFIAAGHLAAKFYGRDPRKMLRARSLNEQRALYQTELKPLFQKRLIRALLNQRASLFGLGIPPAQYDALAGGRPMHEVVEERLSRLACNFDLNENYFAWQAFARSYGPQENAPLPPYLERAHFEKIRDRACRIQVRNISFTEQLAGWPAAHVDRFVLLDAQDWMNDQTLTQLWTEITRTARPGARVIFRTAGEPTILPGRIPDSILGRWSYEEAASREWTKLDRSAVYGGFHLYVLKDNG